MIVAYERISKSTEKLENQRVVIDAYARENNLKIDQYISEIISSTKDITDRKLNALLKRIKRDKIELIIVSELSRLGRSLYEVMGTINTILSSGSQLWVAKENRKLGTDTVSQMLSFAWGLSAQIERELISSRTKTALARLKAEGKVLGRPVGSKSAFNKLKSHRKEIKDLLAKGISKRKIAKLMKISVPTLYRFLKQIQPSAIIQTQ